MDAPSHGEGIRILRQAAWSDPNVGSDFVEATEASIRIGHLQQQERLARASNRFAVESVDPPKSAVLLPGRESISIAFSYAINPDTVLGAFSLTRDGSENIEIAEILLRSNNTVVDLSFPGLVVGSHTLAINAAQIEDANGNALGEEEIEHLFTVVASIVFWEDVNGGQWNDPRNWSTGVVPGPTDHVVINRPGAYDISVETPLEIASLNLGGDGVAANLRINGGGLMALSHPSAVRTGGSRLWLNQTVLNSGDGPFIVEGEIRIIGGVTFKGVVEVAETGEIVLWNLGPVLSLERGLINCGGLQLRDRGWSNSDAEIRTVGGTLINDESGRIQAIVGSKGGLRRVTGEVINRGTITVESGVDLTLDDADLLNTGKIEVAQGQRITFSGGRFVPSTGTVDGAVWLTNHSVLGSGIISPDAFVLMEGGELAAEATLRNEGRIDIWSGVTFLGEFVNSGRVRLRNFAARLTVEKGLLNEGTIILTDQGWTSGDARLEVAGGQLVNALNGIIAIQKGVTGGRREITGNLENLGRVTVDQGAELEMGSASLTNDGIIEIADGQRITFSGGRFVPSTGTVDGAVWLTNHSVLGSGIISPDAFVLMEGGELAAEATLRNEGRIDIWSGVTFLGEFVNSGRVRLRNFAARLTVEKGLLNEGTIILTDQGWTSGDARLEVAGGQLVNALNGIIAIQKGVTGGRREITGNLVNHGRVTVAPDSALSVASLDNVGRVEIKENAQLIVLGDLLQTAGILLDGGTVRADGKFRQSGGLAVLVDNATIAPAGGYELLGGRVSGTGLIDGDLSNSSAVEVGRAGETSVLRVSGEYVQTSLGSLSIDVQGDSTADLLRVDGTASLSGTLHLSVFHDLTALADIIRYSVDGGEPLGAGVSFDAIWGGEGVSLSVEENGAASEKVVVKRTPEAVLPTIACVADETTPCEPRTTITQGTVDEVVAVFRVYLEGVDPLALDVSVESLDPQLIPSGQVEISRIDGEYWRLRIVPADASSGTGRVQLVARQDGTETSRASYELEVLSDGDRDGLADIWETDGMDLDGDGVVEFYLPDADPNRKDLYIEIDAMEGFTPPAAALDMVVQAFDDAPVANPSGIDGINLHLFVDQTDLPVTTFDSHVGGLGAVYNQMRSPGTEEDRLNANRDEGSNPATWSDEKLKAIQRIYARERVFRYVLYGESIIGANPEGRVGYAETPGNDAVIALGRWSDRDGAVHVGASNDQHAGVLMHEIGHMLGLLHGGGDEVSSKPNYFSVMNDLWITPIFEDDPQWRLDFSREELRPIDEFALTETCNTESIFDFDCGIGASRSLLVYAPGLPEGARLVDSQGPVDWDGDGIAQGATVVQDVNGDESLSILAGFDDWQNLKYQLDGAPFFRPGMIVSCLAAVGTCDGKFVGELEFADLPPAGAVAKAIRQADVFDGIDDNGTIETATQLTFEDIGVPGDDAVVYRKAAISENDADWYEWALPSAGLLTVEAWFDAREAEALDDVTLRLEMEGGAVSQIDGEVRSGLRLFSTAAIFWDGGSDQVTSTVLLGFTAPQPIYRYTFAMRFQLAGDANLDNEVDLEDFNTLKNAFGTQTIGMDVAAAWRVGDFNLDGSVDLQDFNILKQQFGSRLSAQ